MSSNKGKPLETFPLFLNGNNQKYLEVFADNGITTNLDLFRECVKSYPIFRSSHGSFSYMTMEDRIRAALKCISKSQGYKLIEDFTASLVQKVDPASTTPPLDIPELDADGPQSLVGSAATNMLPESAAAEKLSEKMAERLSRPSHHARRKHMILHGGGMTFNQPCLIPRTKPKSLVHKIPG